MTARAVTVVRAVRVALFLLVAATLIQTGIPARAQDGGGLGGMQGSAAASGLHVLYNPKGLLPTAAPVDLGAPDALATITSGPSTFARAGVADPGDLLANPDALLAAGSPDWEPGTIPPWPLRISASSSTGKPRATSEPAPGLSAKVEATDSGSTAEATTPRAEAPAVVTVGSMSSMATTESDGSTVTVHSVSTASDINILGIITIDSVITELTATSDGNTTNFEGGTTVSGVTLGDQRATLDADGIHVDPEDGGGPLAGVIAEVTGTANEVLQNAGIHITVAGPVELSDGDEGQLSSTGLRIDLEVSENTYPILGELFDALPPLDNPIPGAPSIEDVLAAARARHLVAVQLGRGVVSLSATPGFEFTPPAIDIDTPTTTPPSANSPAPPIATPPPSSADIPLAPPSQPDEMAAPAPAPVPASNEVPVGTGIAGLVVLALISAPFIGDRIAHAAAAILAAGGPASCTLEDQ